MQRGNASAYADKKSGKQPATQTTQKSPNGSSAGAKQPAGKDSKSGNMSQKPGEAKSRTGSY